MNHLRIRTCCLVGLFVFNLALGGPLSEGAQAGRKHAAAKSNLEGPREYRDEHLTGIELPIGGIGTGSIILDGTGRRDKCFFWNTWTFARLPDTFFAVRVRAGQNKPVVRALQTIDAGEFSRMGSLVFQGEYPFGWFTFEDPALPIRVRMEAFNPLVPFDTAKSGIPCAIFNLTAENTGKTPVEVSFLATHQNCVGYRKGDPIVENGSPGYGWNVNRVVREDGMTGLVMTTTRPKDAPDSGDIILAAFDATATATASWEKRPDLARGFADNGTVSGTVETLPSHNGRTWNGAVAVPFVLQPGEKRTVPFVCAWYFPNIRHAWGSTSSRELWSKPFFKAITNAIGGGVTPEDFWNGKVTNPWQKTAVGQKYANEWTCALDVIHHLAKHLPELTSQTRAFHDTFYASNLPRWLLDGLIAQTAILRSPTCFWNRDGYFGVYEGYREAEHSQYFLDGNCTHVLHYAQLQAYLFPSLSRQLRASDLDLIRPDGLLAMRQTFAHDGNADALDGSCGTILGAYREHLLSADRQWLDRSWPKVKLAMQWIIHAYDANEDGLLTGAQHSTMDDCVFGSTTWMGSLYLASLAACEKMAVLENDTAFAARTRRILDRGKENQDRTLFNGEYYIELGGTKIGTGCSTDQLLGQWWANQLDLGGLYPIEHVRTALRSMLRYNFFPSFRGVPRNRKYASDDDAGMKMITWPKGGRPEKPFYHVDQCWAGSEYPVAALLIQAGLTEEGLKIAQAVRDRYDGKRRPEWRFAPGGNPFGEVEWGVWYTRSLSIWSLLTTCQGFRYDGPAGVVGFDPAWKPEDHVSYFSAAEGWGLFTQRRELHRQKNLLALRSGRLAVKELLLHLAPPVKECTVEVKIAGVVAPAATSVSENVLRIVLPRRTVINEGQSVEINIKR